MQLKKLIVSLLAVTLSTVAFAQSTPQSENPLEALSQQLSVRTDEMTKAFEQDVLPPMKGLISVVTEYANSGQENLTPQQEEAATAHLNQVVQALDNKIVQPIIAELDDEELEEVAQMFAFTAFTLQFARKKIDQTEYQTAILELSEQKLTPEDSYNLMIGSSTEIAIAHFVGKRLISAEEDDILEQIFFPKQTEEEEQ